VRSTKVTVQFEKDVRRVAKRGYDLQKLSAVIAALTREESLERYKDHSLKGNYAGMRECHISPDWLLIYSIAGNVVFLIRTGTHSDLFK